MIAITKAINAGVDNFEDLKKVWYEHEKEVLATKAIRQAKSVKSIKHWTLHGEPKRDYRDYPDSFKR
jgi:hypothetical protein